MSALRVLATSASRSDDMPTSSGFARGRGSAGFAAFWALAEAYMSADMKMAATLRVIGICLPSTMSLGLRRTRHSYRLSVGQWREAIDRMNSLPNVGEVLRFNARILPDKTGARDLERAMTFRQWNGRSCRLANALHGLGLTKEIGRASC